MECSWFRAGKWNLFERSEKIHLVKCNYVKVFPLFSSSVPSCSLSHCSLFSKSSSKGLIKCFSFLRRDWEWICCFEGKVFSVCKNILLCFAFHGRKYSGSFKAKSEIFGELCETLILLREMKEVGDCEIIWVNLFTDFAKYITVIFYFELLSRSPKEHFHLHSDVSNSLLFYGRSLQNLSFYNGFDNKLFSKTKQ